MITLHDYQKQAVRFALHAIRDHGGAGLFLDMGLGKTLTTIAIMDIMYAMDPTLRFLVVAPLLPAYKTWPTELGKFKEQHDLDWTVACAPGMSAAQRLEHVNSGATVTIINQENIAWLDTHVKHWPWQVLILDELSGYKNPSAKRFRALKRRRKRMQAVIGLTGTPTPKGLMDLWSQIYLIDQGHALGATITSYRERWFHPGRRNGHIVYEWLENPDAYERIMNRISPICLTMLARDKLKDLPDMTVSDLWVTMPERTREYYERFKHDMTVSLDGRDVTAVSAGVLTGKLSQFTAGCLYPDPDDPNGRIQHLDDAKLDMLQHVIDQHESEPILVFYQYQDELERMRARWPHLRTVNDPNAVEQWNQGEIPLLAAHPASAKFGLNLQTGGHLIVWLTLTWSVEDWQQANARLARQGQTQRVRVMRILEADTIDERKTRVLEGRENLQESVMRELQAPA